MEIEIHPEECAWVNEHKVSSCLTQEELGLPKSAESE
jgi:hypothetical protein